MGIDLNDNLSDALKTDKNKNDNDNGEEKEKEEKEKEKDAENNLLKDGWRNDKETEKGLFFHSNSFSLEEIDESLERMMGKYPQRGDLHERDNLFNITQSITNGFFYAPSLKEFQILAFDELSWFDSYTVRNMIDKYIRLFFLLFFFFVVF